MQVVEAAHHTLGHYRWLAEQPGSLLFTENETNGHRLWSTPNTAPHVKDAFHAYVVDGDTRAVNQQQVGTKAAAVYQKTVAPGGTWTIRLRLARTRDLEKHENARAFEDFDAVFEQRRQEADTFYASLQPTSLSADEKRVQRQAFAGMLWSKQFYDFNVERWLNGDPCYPPPPESSASGVGIASGDTSTRPTSFPCQTSGNTPGSPPGTWHFTVYRWRSWTAPSPRISCYCCYASGTSTPTATCPRTSGPSATSTRPCSPGPRCASTASITCSAAKRTSPSWSVSSTSCC